ncbi:MAG: proton-conducting transporter membrane subunit [Caldisericia bacterium]|nr:proton-conducting transporter membrane subunit [Caldisericia bacterium]MDD4614151.1 proton-conducting transporter membrane subunit [Caldisericia bacterium]
MELYSVWLLLPFLYIAGMLISKSQKPSYYATYNCFAIAILFVLLLFLYPFNQPMESVVTIANHGPFHISFTMDLLAWITSVFCLIVWFFSSLYSVHYFSKNEQQNIKRYQLFSLLNLMCVLFIFNADNWVTFFIFFELLLVVSYVLIIHYQKPDTYAAGLRYVFFQIIGGLFFLSTIMILYSLLGTTAFVPGGYAILSESSFFIVLFWGFVIAFAVKAGLFPVHIWLPEAHPVAPSPASALLSGMVIKTGVFGIMRMAIETFGISNLVGNMSVTVLLLIAIFTMFWGSAIAIGQSHIKRMLAYSSVSQMGYIVMGTMLLSPIAILGALLHMLAHSIVKSLLFMSAGTMIHQAETTDVTAYSGYGYRSPIVFGAFTIGALSMIGFPLFANFITKWALGVGAVEAIQLEYIEPWLGSIAIGILLLSSILNALYYLPIIIQGWFHVPQPENGDSFGSARPIPVIRYKTPVTVTVTMIVLAVIIVAYGIYPDPIINICRDILTSLTPTNSCPSLF